MYKILYQVIWLIQINFNFKCHFKKIIQLFSHIVGMKRSADNDIGHLVVKIRKLTTETENVAYADTPYTEKRKHMNRADLDYYDCLERMLNLPYELIHIIGAHLPPRHMFCVSHLTRGTLRAFNLYGITTRYIACQRIIDDHMFNDVEKN